MADDRRTPLYDWHLAHGARMVSFAGWSLPIQYPTGIIKEHRACREGAALFDVSHMGIARIAGDTDEAAEALETVLSGDLRRQRVGIAKYTLLLTEEGGIVDDLMAMRHDDDWYLAELGAAAHLGIDFYDFLMRPDRRPSRRELLTLIDLFDRCRYPLLIHCKSGADRTGLASALYRMTRGGESPEEALGAFSVAYGHMPIGGPERLHEPIEEYRAWLRAEGRPHEPRRFRDWVARHYRDERPGDSGPIEPLEPGTRLSPPPPLRAVSIGEAP